ncbi:MAG: deoxyribodipyrimidine photo-lyase [Acidimicrobiales bacterium]
MGERAVVCWFRRDLRLADHPALTAAASRAPVVPLFVHDPAFAGSGSNRVAFLHRTLDSLAAEAGGALVERVGDPVDAVVELAGEVGADEVHVTADFGPYGRRRDAAVAAALAARGVRLVATGSPYAVDPGTVRTKQGRPYRVFTPFSRAWRAHGWGRPLPVPASLRWERPVRSHDRPAAAPTIDLQRWPAGEQAAWTAAERFLGGGLAAYREQRDRPDLDATSRLSPHLKVGSIHPRQLLALVDDGPGAATFAAELCWRDFYADVLLHRPDTVWRNFTSSLDHLEWDEGPRADERFEAWASGTTGYPIVDAGMRQLLAEGWMHNRVRMIVASFLVKDLHLDWRRGARWFLDHLVDGDLASNQHGWQWTAGTGTDAAPFFRIFNPVAQGRRFDPDGDYVRRYVPELGAVAGGAVHEPWRCDDGLFSPVGDYPAPIVDHSEERAEALLRYQRRARP